MALVVDTISGIPTVKINVAGMEFFGAFYDNVISHGVNLGGTVSIEGDPTNTTWGLDVGDGGARFGGNYFLPDAGVFNTQTSLHLVVNTGTGTYIKQVLVGAANSGGSGYRMLRIIN